MERDEGPHHIRVCLSADSIGKTAKDPDYNRKMIAKGRIRRTSGLKVFLK